MNCKNIIDVVFEANTRKISHLILHLKPNNLAKIDSQISTTVDYMEGIVTRYEQAPDPVQTMALSGDIMADVEGGGEEVQAIYALLQLYSLVLGIYQRQSYGSGTPTPGIKLPGVLSRNGKFFKPDIWSGKLEKLWDAYIDWRNNDLHWNRTISPEEIREVWEKLKPLIPTTQCIDRPQIRKIMANDRTLLANEIVQLRKHLVPKHLTRQGLLNFINGYHGLGEINAETDTNKISIFIGDLYELGGWRPSI